MSTTYPNAAIPNYRKPVSTDLINFRPANGGAFATCTIEDLAGADDPYAMTPEDFGAVGDGVADDGPALALASNWLSANPGRRLNIYGTYRAGPRVAPFFASSAYYWGGPGGTNFHNAMMMEGAICISNPQDVTLDFGGTGVILMDNLAPVAGGQLGTGLNGIIFRGPGDGITLLSPRVVWRLQPARALATGDLYVGFEQAGTGGTPGTYALGISGGSGTGAAGTFTVDDTGGIVSWVVTAGGQGYVNNRDDPMVISLTACPGLTGAFMYCNVNLGRTDGDGIRFYGYPSDTLPVPPAGGPPLGVLSNIVVDNAYVQWSPQSGMLFYGCEDYHVGEAHFFETGADACHSSACRRGTMGQISSLGGGDDTCPFVCYYTPVTGTPLYGNPYIDPFGLASRDDPFAGHGSHVSQVTQINCNASGCRMTGCTDVHVASILSINSLQAHIFNGANGDGVFQGWTYPFPNRCTVGDIHSFGDSISLNIISSNNTFSADSHPFTGGDFARFAYDDPVLWTGSNSVGRLFSRGATNLSLLCNYTSGISIGEADIDGTHVQINANDKFNLRKLRITNELGAVIQNTVIVGQNFVSDGEVVTTTLYHDNTWALLDQSIDDILLRNTTIEIQNCPGFKCKSIDTRFSPKDALLFEMSDHCLVGDVYIEDPNETNDGSQNRGVLFTKSKHSHVERLHLRQTTANSLVPVEFGGGDAEDITTDCSVRWMNVYSDLGTAETLTPVNYQTGEFPCTECYWDGKYYLGGEETPEWQYTNALMGIASYPETGIGALTRYNNQLVGIPMVAPGDMILVSYSAELDFVIMNGFCQTAGEANIVFANPTSVTQTFPAGVITARAIKNAGTPQ